MRWFWGSRTSHHETIGDKHRGIRRTSLVIAWGGDGQRRIGGFDGRVPRITGAL
jgi:hypothetical protein